MIKKINNTERITKELRKKGLVKTLNEPEHIKAIFEINEAMQEVRRDFRRKNAESELSASKIIISNQ